MGVCEERKKWMGVGDKGKGSWKEREECMGGWIWR